MRARGRLDHSETDVLSRLSVEKQWVPRFTLVSHEFVGHSRRSLLVLAYFTSCPRFLFRKRCTVQDANDEITYHFEAQEPEDYARLGI